MVVNQEPFEQAVHIGGKMLVNNDDFNQSMVANVRPIFAQVKGTKRVTLKERQEKKYHFSILMFQKCLKNI